MLLFMFIMFRIGHPRTTVINGIAQFSCLSDSCSQSAHTCASHAKQRFVVNRLHPPWEHCLYGVQSPQKTPATKALGRFLKARVRLTCFLKTSPLAPTTRFSRNCTTVNTAAQSSQTGSEHSLHKFSSPHLFPHSEHSNDETSSSESS